MGVFTIGLKLVQKCLTNGFISNQEQLIFLVKGNIKNNTTLE